MRDIPIIISLLGIIYLIYSVVVSKEITIYFRIAFKQKIIVINKEKFLLIQLKYSIINSCIITIIGIIWYWYGLYSFLLLLLPILFRGINYLAIINGIDEGYLREIPM